MPNTFSVLSIKRNRSASKSNSFHSTVTIATTTEPVSKLSKLKSGFSSFSKKLTFSLNTGHYHNLYPPNNQDESKRTKPSLTGLFQYFRNDHSDFYETALASSAHCYDNDGYYEYHQYYKKSNIGNYHTAPAKNNGPPPKKLTSILIKRSNTQPNLKKYTNENNINSEDLTAKQFADIAGIRILPEDEEDDFTIDNINKHQEDLNLSYQRKISQEIQQQLLLEEEMGVQDDMVMRTISSSSKSYCTDSSEFEENRDRLSVISSISLYSYYGGNKPKIWDNEFWVNPEEKLGQTVRTLSHQNSKSQLGGDTDRSTTTTINSGSLEQILLLKNDTDIKNALEEPPILHELRKMGTIKKGRFEIQIGVAPEDSNTGQQHQQQQEQLEEKEATYDDAPFNNQTDGVLEWKRKGKKVQ